MFQEEGLKTILALASYHFGCRKLRMPFRSSQMAKGVYGGFRQKEQDISMVRSGQQELTPCNTTELGREEGFFLPPNLAMGDQRAAAP